ncbi:MAG TPA: archaeosortase/exosortase family protein [Sphingomonas sp.]|jgi:exosortase/archaeosortase family protein
MPPRLAALLVLAACWDAWRLLLGRVGDMSTAVTVLALAGFLMRRAWIADETPVRPAPLATALGVAAVASWTGPALLQIGAAVAAMVLALQPRGRWPVLAVALLALPVLPTLDYLLAYPLRHVSALVSAAMLRMHGIHVDVEGVALVWNDRRLLFDGPCSGVRMVWAALLLAGLVAAVRGLGPARCALLLSGAAVLALFGNALRAAGLFYIETGFIPRLAGSAAHEAVGLAAFALVAGATMALPLLLPRGRI